MNGSGLPINMFKSLCHPVSLESGDIGGLVSVPQIGARCMGESQIIIHGLANRQAPMLCNTPPAVWVRQQITYRQHLIRPMDGDVNGGLPR